MGSSSQNTADYYELSRDFTTRVTIFRTICDVDPIFYMALSDADRTALDRSSPRSEKKKTNNSENTDPMHEVVVQTGPAFTLGGATCSRNYRRCHMFCSHSLQAPSKLCGAGTLGW